MIGRTLGHYRIDRQLGRGGMGDVYRAHDLKLNRPVALKFIRDDLLDEPDVRRRFEREARALAALDHPNIGAVYGFEELDGRLFMVLAYVEGETLDDLLSDGPLPPERARDVLPRIADGLHAAHARGVIHRDIKSNNIMIGAGDIPRLVDFGLARREQDTRVTTTGHLTGTPGFTAPEVIRGEQVDARADIFSLGVVLYHALTGKLPFEHGNPAALLHAILNEAPPRFDATLPEAVRAMEPVVLRCLEKGPADRFADAATVARALRGEAVPPPRKRRQSLIGWKSLALVAALVASAFLIYKLLPQASNPPAVINPRAIAVLDFDNLSADPSFDWMQRGVSELLGTALSQTTELDVFDPQRLASLAANHSKSGREAEVSLDLLRDNGIGLAVVGSILRSQDELRLQGRVLEVATGRVVHAAARGSVEGDLFELTGRLVTDLQVPLEIELTGQATGDEWLRSITTSSVDAYRLFLRGREALIASHWREATRYYEQALAIDSSFIQARADLTGCYWNLGGGARLDSSLAIAIRMREHADRRTSLQIDLLHATVAVDSEKLIRSASELHEIFPENRFFTYLLGRGYYTAKRYDRCVELLEPLVQQRYEWSWTYVLCAQSYDALGRPNEAQQTFELGMEVSEQLPDVAYPYGKWLQKVGRVDQARDIWEASLRSPDVLESPYNEGMTRIELAEFYAAEGDTSGARSQLERSLEVFQPGSREAEIASQALRGLSAH